MVDEIWRLKKACFLCGNRGSSADAQHLAAEFTSRCYIDRLWLAAKHLHCNTPYLSGSQDYGFDEVYSRIINGTATGGDILVGVIYLW